MKLRSKGRKGIVLAASVIITVVAVQASKSEGTAMVQFNSNQPSTSQGAQPFNQKQTLADLRKQITGKEGKPSREVFKNIQFWKELPAERLLQAMEFIYSRSLGVDCSHCHVIDHWHLDDKPEKQLAREMQKMTFDIQQDLAKINNLKSKTPIVTCATCHRGRTKPLIELP